MEVVGRRTHGYKFKVPDAESLESLRSLTKMLKNPGHFQDRYGNLLDILKTKVDVMLLNTLVQFYDPIYHGFTFPDFQLFPTLEEYSHWVGLPVLDEIPFHAFEPFPRIPTIAKALHLEVADIKDKFTTKDGLPCLPYNFLHQKATNCFEKSKTDDFESILALLIYGIVLFPKVDKFVDMNAIRIFLTQNPVPVLLADTYVAIHDRTSHGKGTIVCCTPLLHRWITSHLPRPSIRPEPIPWSQKLMTWTPKDIIWFNPSCDPEFVIDSCGDFNNVPLLGTQGGISYSPILARRQFGYYMEMKPVYLILDRDFFLYRKDDANQRVQFEKAWYSIVKKDRNQLGKRSVIAHEVYVQWVIDRANRLKMSYPRQRIVTSTVPAIPLPLPPESLEGYQKQLDIERREKSIWEMKYRKKEQEYDTLKNLLDQQILANRQEKEENTKLRAALQKKEDFLDRVCPGRKKRRMDLCDGPHSDFED
ncbi:hypothetical protein MTR_4g009470 [Medicago truncatula]|uniref:DUF7745 domain-containing protein n=1 Tax=Medicago truncatula TaxID=3880 RepID=G7JFR0_MEDTR|nr:hypothetical protein MTR_4g009470 [Medicago truncatula]